VAQEKPAIIYHLAALSFLGAAIADGPRTMLETNVGGTIHVLEAAHDAQTPAVVVASSDKQYGALAVPPYDDADSTGFVNGGVYELSKAQQDQTARLYAGLYDAPAIRVARLVNVYGPGDLQWTRIIPGTILRTIQGERPRVTAGPAGAALREYLFVDDAVQALRALADDALANGNAPHRRADGKLARVAYNLSSGHYHAAANVIDTIRRLLREDFGIHGPEPEILPGTPGIFEPGSQFTAGARIRALLPGDTPRSLADGLLATLPYYVARLANAPI
jgi:CDP-glucose 4,6-dehydratase